MAGSPFGLRSGCAHFNTARRQSQLALPTMLTLFGPTLVVARWILVVLAVACATRVPAQSILNYQFIKRVTYIQASASALTFQDAQFIAAVTRLGQMPAGLTATLMVGTVVHPLGIGSSAGNALQREFATISELESTFPSGARGVLRLAAPLYLPRENIFQLPNLPFVQMPVMNYDELQRCESDDVVIQYRPAAPNAVAWSSSIGGSFQNVLRIYRAPDIHSVSGINLVRAQQLDMVFGARITIPDLPLAPGETLYGELYQTDRSFFITEPAVTGTEVLVRFPIHRLAGAAPVILAQPTSRTVRAGESVVLSIEASGAELTYQWYKDGVLIPEATTATLELKGIQTADTGRYHALVRNAGGVVQSEVAIISLLQPPTATTPANQTVKAGAAVAFETNAAGSGPFQYQWLRNGEPIAGATSGALGLASVRLADAGSYAVRVTNAAGSVVSGAAMLTVEAISRISNLSIRARVDEPAGPLTVGFTLGGAQTSGPKPILLRAVGPTLTGFGVDNALANPRFALVSAGATVAQNDDWGGESQVATTSTAVGAFALASAGSRDAALLHQASAGGYTVEIKSADATSGVTLTEVYDATPGADFTLITPRLTNVSALTQAGPGAEVIVGFAITGSTPVTLLIRGIGPTLANFGVGSVLGDPRLDIFDGGATSARASNDNWGTATNATQIAAAASTVGAFALAADSRDAVLLIALPPGTYTAQAGGAPNAAGSVLVELYEVP